jgi:hypothetical protein
MTGPAARLRRLEGLGRRRSDIESAVAQAVAAARTAGASWSAVGAALGVSAQAVQQRYGPTSNGKPGRAAAAKDQPLLKRQGSFKPTNTRARLQTQPRRASIRRAETRRHLS